jgi:hypothetical protein
MPFDPHAYILYAIVARGPSGSTPARELITGLNELTKRVEELLESDHEVHVYECVERKYEVTKKFTIVFEEE